MCWLLEIIIKNVIETAQIKTMCCPAGSLFTLT